MKEWWQEFVLWLKACPWRKKGLSALKKDDAVIPGDLMHELNRKARIAHRSSMTSDGRRF